MRKATAFCGFHKVWSDRDGGGDGVLTPPTRRLNLPTPPSFGGLVCLFYRELSNIAVEHLPQK